MESIRPPVPAPNSCCQPGTNDKASSHPNPVLASIFVYLQVPFLYLQVLFCTCKYLFVLAAALRYTSARCIAPQPRTWKYSCKCLKFQRCECTNVHIAGPEPTSRHPLIMAPLHCCVGYYYAGTEPSAINPMFDATHGTTLAPITNHGIICTCQSQPCKTDTSYFETGNLITLVPLWLIWQGGVTGAKKLSFSCQGCHLL